MNDHILKFGDLVVIQGGIQPKVISQIDDKNKSNSVQNPQRDNSDARTTGFLSAVGFTDKRVFLQSLPPNTSEPLKTAASWNNYSDLVFQIWPKLSYEAHKQLKKLKDEKRLVEAGADDSVREAFEEKLRKLGNRVEDEKASNQKLLSTVMGVPVVYGAEIQIMHICSKSFLTAKVACSESDKSAYKFELFDEVNSGMTFKLLPRYRIRQEGEPIQFEDQILLYSVKLNCQVNFTNDKPIEIDEKVDISPNVPSITVPYALRQISKSSQRYEAHVSQFTDCTWKIHFYGKHKERDEAIFRGGNLIKLKHTELNAYLAASSQVQVESTKVYGREYIGEFPEEENTINTIWEVEIDDFATRGAQCIIKDDQNNPKPLKLRHFLTGKVLSIGDENMQNQGNSSFLTLGSSQKSTACAIFRSFATNSPNELYYNAIYGIGVSVDGKNFKYITAHKDQKYKEISVASNDIFKPLAESEFSVEKTVLLAQTPELNAENAFTLLKVDPEEESNIRFVSSSIHILQHFLALIKSPKSNPKNISPSILAKVIHVLKDLIFFVHKIDPRTIEQYDAITYDGITVCEKQRLLKDFRIIEILTEIIYYPFKLGDNPINLKDINNPSFQTIFQCCYRLIKHTIKEYRPNELYASQWLEHYMAQAMVADAENDIKAEATLIELIDNNKKILNTRINKETIGKFVKMLKENKNEKFVNLLRALCVCDGEAVVKNQTEMSFLIVQNEEIRNHLIYQHFRNNSGSMIEIRLKEYEAGSSEFWSTIPMFQTTSKEMDNGENFKYFLSMIYLLSDLCLERNYIAINYLKPIYTYDLCFRIISDNSLTLELRTAFVKLLNTLWIDKNPYQRLNIPRYLIAWDDINANSCSEIASANLEPSRTKRFDGLKEYLKNYYASLAKAGCTKIYEVENNKFTSVLLETTQLLVEFGLFQTIDQLKELTKPLLVLLNGMKDAKSPSDFEQFRKSFKAPQRKSIRRRLFVKDTGTSEFDEKNGERYTENEDTLIVMNCKNQICELMKVIMDINNDLCLRKFLYEFKKDLEFQKDREELSELNFSKRSPHHSLLNKMPLRSQGEKKSLFGNYKIFGGNEENSPIDYVQTTLHWVKNIIEKDPLDIKKLAPTNFVRMLFDLSLYEHENLVKNSFSLLHISHSRRLKLKDMLQQVQILEDQEKKRTVETIEQEIRTLRELAETTENWYGNDDPESQTQTNECIRLIKKLGNYLVGDAHQVKEFIPESDTEIITTPPKINQEFELHEEDYVEDEQNVDPEFQVILKHLKGFEPMIEILEYENARVKDGNNINKINVLREVFKFLAKFAHHQKPNQTLLMEHFPIYLTIMTNYHDSGVETLIEELFKGNKSLIRQTNKVEKFANYVLSMITDTKKCPENKKPKLLLSLKSLMRHKKQSMKVNQTAVLSLLTSKDFKKLFVDPSDRDEMNNIKESLRVYNNKIAEVENNGTLELPPNIDYLAALLEILGVTCEGKNAVTESRCQSSWPLRELAYLYEKANKCWILKRSILYFFYHVYLDTEREMKEEAASLNRLFLNMIADMKFISENFDTKYEIRHYRGAINNKTAVELFYFEALLPCVDDILSKRFYANIQDYKTGLTYMLQHINKMENIVVNRNHKKAIKNTLTKFRLHTKEIYEEVYNRQVGSYELLFDGTAKDHNKKKEQPLYSSIVREDNTKTLKLRMRLSMLDERNDYQEYSEEEFEQMVMILIDIEKHGLDDPYSSFLPFNDVIKSLISLVDIKEGTLDKDLTLIGMKLFRKIIERENKSTFDCAAEWESEDWMKFEKKIIEKQNELCEVGMVDMICHTISQTKDIELQHESILVGIAMLIGGNPKVQKAFLKYIQNDGRNDFLNSVKKLIDKNFDIIKKEMSQKNKYYANQLLEREEEALRKKLLSPDNSPIRKMITPTSLKFDGTSSKELEIDDEIIGNKKMEDVEEARLSLIVLQRVFRFLQLFCEGHNLDMQDQLRNQTDSNGATNGKSQDFISSTAYYFNTLMKMINVDCLDVGVQMLDFLIEAVQGPCEGNQLALARAKIINSCMDFLTMFVKDIDYQKRGFTEPDQVAKVHDGTTTAMNVLNALLEGLSYPEIIEEMSALDLRFLIAKLTQEYETFVKDKLKLKVENVTPALVTGKLNADSFDQQMLESFDVCILLVNLADHNKKVAAFLKDTEAFTPREVNALKFFRSNLANIEILFKDKLLKVYFPIYPVCRYLSTNSRKGLMANVNRESPNEKINGLVGSSDELFDEMTHMAFLKSHIPIFSPSRYNLLRDFSTIISLIINIIIISTYYYTVNDGVSVKQIGNGPTQAINVFGYIQIVTSCLMIVFWLVINAPMILRRRWRQAVEDAQVKDEDHEDILAVLGDDYDICELPLHLVLEVLRRKGPYDPVFNQNGKRDYGHVFVRLACYWRNLTFLMSEGKFVFMAFYLIVSVLGVAISEITYSLHLLDVINRSDVLRNVVKAVTHNVKQLLSTALLGIIMIYIYSIVGFFFSDDSYYNGDVGDYGGERQCQSMLQCYLTTLNWGLRNGGGIGDTIKMQSYNEENRGPYYFRLVFDLSFFIIINIVFLNIIFGIIIDTFAELRDQKSMIDEDMKTICFICNLDRYTFDKNGGGFENHIEKHHHLWNYLYFIYCVNAKDPTEYNGIESYVQEKLQAEDISWFPLHKAIELGDIDHQEK